MQGSEEDQDDEAYADVASAMELAFGAARERQPDLSREDLFVALLLLKDRILEQHIPPDSLPPALADVARKLYSI